MTTRASLPRVEQQRLEGDQHVVDVEGEPGAPQRARALRLLSDLQRSPHDRVVATDFNEAAVALARHPSAPTRDLLREVSELSWLRGIADERGWPCRAAVLWAWSELGYPWALELSAEDLAFVRENVPGRSDGWLTLSLVLSSLSALLHGSLLAFGLASVGLTSLANSWALMGFAPFAGMGAHALATLAATRAAQANAPTARGRLWALALAGALVPVVSVLLTFVAEELAVVMLVVGFPMMASSLAAGVAASRLRKP